MWRHCKRIYLHPTVRVSLVLILVLVACVEGNTAAQTPGAVSQGYHMTGGSQSAPGELVTVENTDASTVQPATRGLAGNLIGVISDNPVLALSDGANQVQVVIGGTTPVLVSDINGPVHAGDRITASPIAGIGMRASADTQVIGSAQASFSAAGAPTQIVTDTAGKQRTVHIGQIPVLINVGYYVPPSSKMLPPFLQDLANNIAGRPVSLVRILFAGLLLVASLIGVSILLYGGIRSGMISLGRNPLAGSVIRRGIVELCIAALLVLIFSLLTAYVILSF